MSNYLWTPKTRKNMKVLGPKNMGEITPKNEGNVGFHGRIITLFIGEELFHPSYDDCTGPHLRDFFS